MKSHCDLLSFDAKKHIEIITLQITFYSNKKLFINILVKVKVYFWLVKLILL